MSKCVIYRENDYLVHHGVKGMRWGIRRDRGRASGAVAERIDKATSPTIKNGKDRERISPAEKTVREGQKITNELSNINNRAAKSKARKSAHEMSDAELRKAIDRLRMEQQYNELKSSSSTSKGRKVVDDILAYTGSTLAIVGAGLSIYTTVKGLK